MNFRLKNYFYHRRRGGHGGPRPRRSQAPANYFNPATIGAPTQADYFDPFPGEATAPAKVFRPRPWRGTTLADFFYPASAGAAASHKLLRDLFEEIDLHTQLFQFEFEVVFTFTHF